VLIIDVNFGNQNSGILEFHNIFQVL